MKKPILIQATDLLQRARKLPAGSAREELRQLAEGLMKLHRKGVRANVQIIAKEAELSLNDEPVDIHVLQSGQHPSSS